MKLDEKWIFLLWQTEIQNDNLCRNLVGTMKLSPSTWASTTSIPLKMESSQRQWKAWERQLMAS